MTRRGTLAGIVFVIAPVGIATWILATHTIGEELDSRNETLIGFAVALLAVATAASLLFLVQAASNLRVGIALIICGTACIIAAVALQFYLASVTAQNSRRVAEILGEHWTTNPSASLNVNADYPQTVPAISYFAIFTGIWMAAMGARLGIGANGSSDRSSSATPFNKDKEL